ncbi:lytic transglycosylase domain-containing protein [Qipengyuania sp. JC766]|uniref:lytic transglycosylase domain-containing protein n=1 Tax=Qipengyuania sp. JC766 TaxID=3232139 RepID=UPI0034578A62
MSSMDRITKLPLALLALTALTAPTALCAQDPGAWEQARRNLVASAPTGMEQAVERWEFLIGQRELPFNSYASFILAYPDFPQEERLRTRAELALAREQVSASNIVAFFDAKPPLTNEGRAQYALALQSLGRDEAFEMARAAWRGGEMSAGTESYLDALFANRFQIEDHDARMDALLWQEEAAAAQRMVARISPSFRDMAMARLMLVQGQRPVNPPAAAKYDANYTYNLVRHTATDDISGNAVAVMDGRPQFAGLPFDAEDFIGETLTVARAAGPSAAARIAASVDDMFPTGADISKESYRLRDDYTSLMWLGGTEALWNTGNGTAAAPLFYRYGAAAQTPQTRSKGFYWAGLASERAGNQGEAQRYYGLAAQYPDRFYGQLALAKLMRPVPPLGGKNAQEPSAQERAAFATAPLTLAVKEVAKGKPWRTGIQFYQAIADQADTEAEHMLVTELAREIGRRDLAVNVAEAAGADGHDQFVAQGFPLLMLPPGADFTMVHAIARQESQFADNAISHAGARGLMQLMPATANEQAGKLGLSYSRDDLIASPTYNIQLGNGYFFRMLSYYDNSYPLAIAAYNAGPGNVNRWLRANGDPRRGGIDWVTWIERIPIFETKNYVQRVIENAAVYEQLYPDRIGRVAPRTAVDFLR